MNNLNYDKKLSEDFKLEICWFHNFYMFLACLSINKNYEMLNIQTTSRSKAFCRKLLDETHNFGLRKTEQSRRKTS